MITRSEKSQASQNMGLADRILRLMIGAAMLAGGSVFVVQAGALHAYNILEAVMLITMMVSVYPLLTAILGVDPVYSLFNTRTCSDSGRNQCGTFPYQVKAALGKAPRYCEASDDHSLEGCHDESEEKPHHAVWRVDKEPMLYPDDKAMAEFADRERRLKMSHK